MGRCSALQRSLLHVIFLLGSKSESKLFRPRRPRSSSDALSASFNGELLGTINRCNSYDNLPHDNESDGDEGLIHVPALISPRSAEDVDLSPPDIGVASLDFDPMSFQCSPPKAESECLDSSISLLESMGFNKDKPRVAKKDLESGSQSQTPGSATSSEPVSPFQEKMSPFFTLDLSPTEEKASKTLSFSEKVAHAFSPKTGRKPIKFPLVTISEPVSLTLPRQVCEGMPSAAGSAASPNWSKSVNEATNRSPTQRMSLPLKASEMAAGEGYHQEAQTQVTAAKPELQEEGERPMPSSQNKTVPSGHNQPGAVALDSPQDPVPVSSVSLIPPPPPKNAARMLALALAESAQQASTQSQKKPGDAHSDCTNYGETDIGIAIEKVHLSAGAPPDKLHLYTGVPENQIHFQSGAPVDQDLTRTPGDRNHLHSSTPGNRDQPHLHTGMPGDLHSGTKVDWNHSNFHTGTVGDKDHFPSHPGGPGDWEHTPLHTGALLGREPSTTDVPIDKPHLHTCISMDTYHIPAEKLHLPASTADDKLQPPPVAAREKTAMATMTYMTTIQTPATEMSHGTAGQHTAAEPDVIVTAAQRILMTNSLAPSQRQADHQPAMGQVPAVATIGSSSSNQVSDARVHPRPLYVYLYMQHLCVRIVGMEF
ncbi:NADP-dependent oxidoreductase [Platysternon megacephalum]|uniref:NADP-dependent oxidoreductase n=1 Tax=Platysternon megacephalum TaxID=55544 RepID=A0A4D9DDS0_9SAUR|nr:NADP-dependent oxidoreductase [Platysternon megacephalum]